MGNVVIVTHWLDGDVIPFIRIGKELKGRGHDVTLITHCNFKNLAEKAGLEFRSWDTPEEYVALVDEMQQNKVDNSKGNTYSFSASAFRQRYESNEVRLKEYNIILECCHKQNTVILCKNRSSVAAYLVAEKCKLPLATVMMNPTEVSSMLLYEKLEGMNDLPRLNALRESVDLSSVDSWLQWESSAKMTLALWPKWYDEVEDEWPVEIETIGFPIERGKEAFCHEIPSGFELWLKKNPNPIVITGGTTKCINDKLYTSSIEACGLLGQPTVVLSRYREFLPEVLPDNVIWYEYLPLDLIMPKINVLIHHGGMGTLSGALSAGIPQLILPCYVDRPYNATLIKKLGVGDFLYPVNWQPEKIASMIKSLQNDNIRDNCKKYVSEMRNNSGITVAADRVELLMKDSKYVYSINSEYEILKKITNDNSSENKRSNLKQTNKKLTNDQKSLLLNIYRRKKGSQK